MKFDVSKKRRKNMKFDVSKKRRKNMKFDVSKIYTVVNADELKVGSKVIVADTLETLKDRVAQNGPVEMLRYVKNESAFYRFRTQGQYALAYLVEEPAKLKWTDLKVGDAIQRDTDIVMVTQIDTKGSWNCHIFAGAWLDDTELCKWRKVEQ